jgi:hypothetical protein
MRAGLGRRGRTRRGPLSGMPCALQGDRPAGAPPPRRFRKPISGGGSGGSGPSAPWPMAREKGFVPGSVDTSCVREAPRFGPAGGDDPPAQIRKHRTRMPGERQKVSSRGGSAPAQETIEALCQARVCYYGPSARGGLTSKTDWLLASLAKDARHDMASARAREGARGFRKEQG